MLNKEPLQLSKLNKKEFPLIKSLTHEQTDMVEKLYKKKRVIVDSLAGTGKTTVATQAMKVLKDKGHVNRIYYVVFPVQERSLGFLPGDLKDKIKEYAIPFIQALIVAGVPPYDLDIDVICDEYAEGDYKVVPHTFLRGRNIERTGVILDEIQNGTIDELQKSFSRITDDCYVAVIGHEGQTDISKNASGFSRYKDHFRQGIESGIFTEIAFAELTHNFRGEWSSFCDQIRR